MTVLGTEAVNIKDT